MTEFTLSLAGIPIRAETFYESTADYCRDYLCSETPALCVTLTQADLDYEREKVRQRAGNPLCAPSGPSLDRLALYRKIAAALLERDILLMHGSVMAVDGRAYVFAARSGTGKTTHSRLWLSQFPECHILNGDKPLLRVEKDRVLACGTPWQGKECYGRNEMLPLAAICLLERDSVNRIEAVTLHDVLPNLVKQFYCPDGPTARIRTIELIGRIADMTKLYRLRCNTDPEAAQVSFRAMCRGETP